MRIAVIGGGVSGIAAARVLSQFGHQVVLFERSAEPGGVWSVAYPEVRLQNVAEHYRLSDFPWPSPPDQHPSREQILDYLRAAVAHYRLDLRTRHEVTALHEEPDGWQVDLRTPQGPLRERFDFVLLAAGHYTGEPQRLKLADRERFAGTVVTDRDVRDLSILDRPQIAVVGFGKSALDMATLAAERGARVHHVFRSPRWLLPKHIFGVHASKLMFSRMSTAMIPAWVQPTAAERFLHNELRPLVEVFWSMLESVVWAQFSRHARDAFGRVDPERRRRIAKLVPERSLTYEMRSASALAPDRYVPLVASGQIELHRGEVAGLTPSALRLSDGRELPCELVVLSTGFTSPRFPFLPRAYRDLVEAEDDGVQLYRHLLHPRIPRLAFAGFNHSFLHVPGVEIATLWLGAYLRGDLVLPPVEEMERRIGEVRDWKRANILFEPSRSCGVSTRFHQYSDVLLGDLGLRRYRKSNPLAELLSGYSAEDYRGLIDEYLSTPASLSPRYPLPLST